MLQLSQVASILALLQLSSSAALSRPAFSRASTSTALAASEHCGDYDYVILSGTPWIVYNMLYNAHMTVGTHAPISNPFKRPTLATGNPEVVWSSVTDIEYVESTNNVPKGYSFVGLTQNLEITISDISSIPASYAWTGTNATDFKGNVCFDFMVSDTKGDSTSTSAQELMLWLQYEGGQLPIGWEKRMLPDTQFDGSFEGDLKECFEALVALSKFTNETYVNVGNAGTEFFYGDSILNATLGLQIDLS
ncbi:related to endoglucanase I precursor [Phialocephala subalpina]|uniref:Related to endoglucanase I n=1 Tax=Phialocephala subalpina TaxID=576137 RepID=A0A1L7X1D1_9HELO|nr:related to endoglucanase I precursor [Phialocephala subalpina]